MCKVWQPTLRVVGGDLRVTSLSITASHSIQVATRLQPRDIHRWSKRRLPRQVAQLLDSSNSGDAGTKSSSSTANSPSTRRRTRAWYCFDAPYSSSTTVFVIATPAAALGFMLLACGQEQVIPIAACICGEEHVQSQARPFRHPYDDPMGDRWRKYFESADGGLAHPDSPDAAAGAGSFRQQEHPEPWDSHVPHPSSPAAMWFDWSVLPGYDEWQRAMAVRRALDIAEREATDAVLEATGEELKGKPSSRYAHRQVTSLHAGRPQRNGLCAPHNCYVTRSDKHSDPSLA
jgi:hypothetical protein